MPVTYQQRARSGTATASGSVGGGETPDKAFDGISNTKWNVSDTSPWLQYQLTAAQIIVSYVIMSANDAAGRDPVDWTLKASNTGAFAGEEVTLDTRTGEDFPLRFQQRVFQFTNTTAYEYYRLDISANAGDTNTQLAELGLFTRDFSSDDVAYGGAALSGNQASSGGGDGSEKPDKAFDKSFTGGVTKWNDNKIALTDFWLQYDFGEDTAWKITSYTIVTANDATERDPKTWTLEASNTGSFAGEEVVVDTVADGALSDTRGASKTFTCDSPPASAYRYYRLVVSDLKDLATANSIQLAELNLIATEDATAFRRMMQGIGQ